MYGLKYYYTFLIGLRTIIFNQIKIKSMNSKQIIRILYQRLSFLSLNNVLLKNTK